MADRHEIVAHVTTGNVADWRQAIRNLSNLYQDEQVSTPPNAITLVVNGDAVRFLLQGGPEAAQISRMAAGGITIHACSNSLDRLGYSVASLAEGVEPVQSGVAEVVRLQNGGVVYLKLP